MKLHLWLFLKAIFWCTNINVVNNQLQTDVGYFLRMLQSIEPILRFRIEFLGFTYFVGH